MCRQNLFINDPLVLLEKQNTLSEENEITELSNARISSLLFVDHLTIFSLLNLSNILSCGMGYKKN